VRRPIPALTQAELAVMKALWKLRTGTVADIRAEHGRLFASDLAYTTVMTLLGRLAGKGAVKVDRDRQPFVYRAALRRDTVLRERLDRFVGEVFDGDADALVVHLVEDGALSLDDLRRIHKALKAVDGKGRG
jgi:BlaI family penicillinase repressor